MLVVAITLVLLLSVILLLLRKEKINFESNVEELLASSGAVPHQIFSYEQLEDLPEPVQRYFRYALKEGQPYISYVHVKHKGEFKTKPDGKWVNIKGEQHFTIAKPGFIWKGRTALFTAYDSFVNDKGRLTVKLFSLFKLFEAQGPEADEAELQRWLSENFWFPTNLLPNQYLQWETVDRYSAKLICNYKHLSFSALVRFNAEGQFTSIELERYMEPDRLEKWLGKASDYREYHGIMIPTSIEAVWKLDTGDYSYARFELTDIEYD